MPLSYRTPTTRLPIDEHQSPRFSRCAMRYAILTAFSLLLAACQSLAPALEPAKTPSVSSLRTWQPTPPERSFRPCAALVKEQAFQTILNAMENILKPDGPDVPMSEAVWSKNLESLPDHISSVFDQYTNGTKPLKLVFAEIIASQYGDCLQLTEHSFLGFSHVGTTNFGGLFYVQVGGSPALRPEGSDDLGRIIAHGYRVTAEVSSDKGERVVIVQVVWSNHGFQTNGYKLLRILPNNTLKTHPLVWDWKNFGCATIEVELGCGPPESELFVANRSSVGKFQFGVNNPAIEFAINAQPLSSEPETGTLLLPFSIGGPRPMRVDFRLLEGKLDHTVTFN